MTPLQQAAWRELMHFQVGISALFILLVTIGLMQSRFWLRRYPVLGSLIGYALIVVAFALYKMSRFNQDARFLFSSGLLSLAVSVIASLIVSDPPARQKRQGFDGLEEAVSAATADFRRRVDEINSAKISDLHRQLKLQELAKELHEYLDAVNRVREREERA